eukprot:Gregarina_sp_Poly_1__7265@NODE_39_length_18147_cov_101_572069_g34_i0_p2_GENE_NODE_39_length_18147_cov_101_572069_g34_i0NODE_39_length_18147_cov_101_572069_g34_i0_p2_ORF_typecomplete_len582_score47_23EMP70/PF02990_16/1_7e107HKR_ArcB_TM/PF18415_1/17HKR_ArcB_TM/PF18415_1/30_NODE_39_length_18147_cov_101_572069_g34_i01051850
MSAAWLIPLVLSTVAAEKDHHTYHPGDVVQVWADRVGPWASPRESYSFEELPTCELWGLDLIRKPLSLGEAFEGVRYTLSPRIAIVWPNDDSPDRTEPQEICRVKLTTEIVHSLSDLIKDQWYYSYTIDGLPVQGFLGQVSENGVPQLYAHKTFVIEKNFDKIIAVSVIPGEPVELLRNHDLRLTYNVKWLDTNDPFSQRMKRYYSTSFFETRVQWFSTIMSCVFGLFLTGILMMILARTVRDDFSNMRVSMDESEAFDRYDEAGWKMISKEVFRKPKKLRFHSILCSTGWHLSSTCLLAAIMAVIRISWGYRPMTMTCLWWLYALTQPINGFSGSYFYVAQGGRNWKSTAVWQLLFFPLIILALFLQLNTAYAAYGSTLAIPMGTLASAVFFFILFHPVLHYMGALVGKRKAINMKLPVKPNTLERPVPPYPAWIKGATAMLAGALPFGCLIVEVYFVYDSFWTHRNFYFYGFLLAVLIIYAGCTAASTVTAVYLLLNKEDHKWQWYAFGCGASTGIYLLGYSLFYYNSVLAATTGFFHAFTYWVYTIVTCLGLAIASGAIGTLASYAFVRRIYMNIKSD